MLVLGIVVVRAALMIVRRAPDLRAAAWFAAGLLPPAAVGFYFRTALAPRSPQFGQKAGTMLGQVLDPGRYAIILRAGAYELARGMGPVLVGLIVYAVLLGRTRDPRARRMAANVVPILLFALLGYGFTYLTARAELTWVMSHSIDRLELQLWPSILLVFFMYVGSPTEQEAALPRQASVDRRRPRERPAAAAGARPGSERTWRAPLRRRLLKEPGKSRCSRRRRSGALHWASGKIAALRRVFPADGDDQRSCAAALRGVRSRRGRVHVAAQRPAGRDRTAGAEAAAAPGPQPPARGAARGAGGHPVARQRGERHVAEGSGQSGAPRRRRRRPTRSESSPPCAGTAIASWRPSTRCEAPVRGRTGRRAAAFRRPRARVGSRCGPCRAMSAAAPPRSCCWKAKPASARRRWCGASPRSPTASGYAVVRGQSDSDCGAPSYWTWIQVLRELLTRPEIAAVRRRAPHSLAIVEAAGVTAKRSPSHTSSRRTTAGCGCSTMSPKSCGSSRRRVRC